MLSFFRPDAADLDWHEWLSDARTRYAVAQRRCEGSEVAGAVPPEIDDDGAVTPDFEDGARTPSDGEVASEDDLRGVSAPARLAMEEGAHAERRGHLHQVRHADCELGTANVIAAPSTSACERPRCPLRL